MTESHLSKTCIKAFPSLDIFKGLILICKCGMLCLYIPYMYGSSLHYMYVTKPEAERVFLYFEFIESIHSSYTIFRRIETNINITECGINVATNYKPSPTTCCVSFSGDGGRWYMYVIIFYDSGSIFMCFWSWNDSNFPDHVKTTHRT